MKSFLFCLLILLNSAFALITTPPTQDPFYTPPEGYKDLPNGSILRWRKTPNPIGVLLFPSKVKESYQILFKGTDNFGNATYSANTIIIPEDADLTKLVSFEVAEDSAYYDCAPSYGLQIPSNPDAIISQVEYLFMLGVLNLGYPVVVPDYEGPNSAFTVGTLEGLLVLDSLRATLNSTDFTGISSDAKIVLWGYSGGSIAAGWAAQYRATYAPEVAIAGVALGGVVPNISAVAAVSNSSPFSGLIPSGITGIFNQYPELEASIAPRIKNKDKWDLASKQCLIADLLTYLGEDVFGTYFEDGIGLLSLPNVVDVVEENHMGKVTPDVPIYIYHSENDEVAPVDEVDDVVNGWCADGIASLSYNKDLLSGHVTTEVFGSGNALLWIEKVMKGQSLQRGCKTSISITTLLQPRVIEILGLEAVNILLNLVSGTVTNVVIDTTGYQNQG